MGLFNKLFGSTNKTNNNSNSIGDSPATWSAKFVLLTIAEESSELPSEEETQGLLESAFPHLSTSDFANLHSDLVKAHRTCSNNKEGWEKYGSPF